MNVVAWITESGWEACVDAVARLAPDQVTLVHVADADFPGPRGPRHERVMARMGALAGEAARALLDDAEERLRGGPGGLAGAADRVAAAARGEPVLAVRKLAVSGEAETEVLAAAEGADALVLTREGTHPGPHSLGHAARYIVDHAPCTVVLVPL